MSRYVLDIVRDRGRLAALRQSGLLDSQPEERFDRYTRLGRELAGTSGALVTLVDEDRQFFKSQVGLSEPWASERETPLALSYCKYTVAGEDLFVVEDAREPGDGELELGPIVEELGILAYLGVPLRPFGDHTIGTFALFHDEPRSWSPEDEEIVGALGAAVEREIQRAAARTEDVGRPVVAYRDLVEGLPVGIIVHRGGTLRYANAAATRVLGFESPTEATGRQLLEFVVPEERERVSRQVREVQEGREPIELQRYEVVTAKGARRTVDAMAVPVRWKREPAVQVVIQDVTDLELSQRKYRRLFELNPVPVSLSTMEDGRFVEVNRAFEQFVRYDADELIGFSAVTLGLWVNQEDRREFVRRARRQGMAQGLEARVRRKTGEVREVELFGTSLEIDGEEHLLAITHDLTDRIELERELEEVALHDPLTGRANRILFRDRVVHALERAERESSRVAVVYLDLDRFKVVNDSLGPTAGDQILQDVADRLGGRMRDEDSLARIGGDEFAVLVEGLAAVEEVRPVVERLMDAFREPFTVKGTEVPLTASLGIAVSEEGLDHADALMRFSDAAAFEAKEETGTSYSVFDLSSEAREMTRLHRENELRRAIEQGQLELHYQPFFSLSGGRIVGAEALVRWAHPERGLLLPSEFIELAEETGLIRPLGEWVLEEALTEAARWRESGGLVPDFWLSVNVSAQQFQSPAFTERVKALLATGQFPPDQLLLEITESIMMKAPGRVGALREQGVGVAVDDFGTGYSSLQYLRELALDVLKIDRSFVDRLSGEAEDVALVEAILHVAERWGLTVIGEGVETEGQAEILRELGCPIAQGFHFERPMPAEDFRRLIDALEEGSPPWGGP